MMSMTGFGRAQGSLHGKVLQVEIRSLNSKGMDLSMRLPSFLNEKEPEIRGLLLQQIERGKVTLSVYQEQQDNDYSMNFNAVLAGEYLKAMKTFARDNHMPEADLMQALVRIPDVFRPGKTPLSEQDWEQVKILVNAAITEFMQFRLDEGAQLFRLFTQMLDTLTSLLEQIEALDVKRMENLRSRMRQHLTTLASEIKIDESRFEQEMLYYMEKLDVAEEKNRLATHLKYFRETMSQPSSGRKLGFISQEIGREINTIGAKSNDADMQKCVVLMKDELERIKEQLNNIE